MVKPKNDFLQSPLITHPREQYVINSDINVFIKWLHNELRNIPVEFSLFGLSTFQDIDYALELKTKLFEENINDSFFITGNIIENDEVISEIFLIKFKYFIVGLNEFILEVSSVAEYHDLRSKKKKPEELLLNLIFGGVSPESITKEIQPLILWLKSRIINSPFYIGNKISTQTPKLNPDSKILLIIRI